jgi:phenylacetate-CoA ligase
MEDYKFDRHWDRIKIESLQLNLLQKQLDYIWQRSKFYRSKFQEVGLTPSDIKTLKDIEKIPFTTKEELRKYNEDFICVPKEDVVDYCSTTGTTGKPVLAPLTSKDWRIRIESFKERFSALEIKKGDIVQNSMAFDQLFGVCIFYDAALKELGITSLRLGPGNSKRQIEIMLQVGTTVIIAVPEYMLVLAETAREMGLNPAKDFKLKKGILITQNLYTKDWKPNALKKEIEEIWQIETFSGYGSTELMLGFYECLSHAGQHIPSQEVIVEIINPETYKVLGPEQVGELVFTHLIQESMPLLRFRQGDITYLKTGACACGYNTPRMMSIIGRTDQMVKIKGASFYPYQIEEVLMAIPEVSSYLIEVFTDERGLEQLKIKACILADQERLIQRIKGDVKSETRVTPIVEVSSKDEIEVKHYSIGTRKVKKFWDNRLIKTN